jgi:hypothetical protein
MSEKIIDAEFTDVDGEEKGGKRVLEQVADVAEHIANPVEALGAEKAAHKIRQAAFVAREVDGLIEEGRPLMRKAEGAIERALRLAGLEGFNDRDIMKR